MPRAHGAAVTATVVDAHSCGGRRRRGHHPLDPLAGRLILDNASIVRERRYPSVTRDTGISKCVVTTRRTSSPRTWFKLDELPAGIDAPVGNHLQRCFEARELLAGLGDDGLLEMCPRIAPETRLEHQFMPDPEGWAPLEGRLRMTAGLRFKQPVDSHVANLLVRCDGTVPVRELLAKAATAADVPADTLVREGTGAISQLIEAGFLLTR